MKLGNDCSGMGQDFAEVLGLKIDKTSISSLLIIWDLADECRKMNYC